MDWGIGQFSVCAEEGNANPAQISPIAAAACHRVVGIWTGITDPSHRFNKETIAGRKRSEPLAGGLLVPDRQRGDVEGKDLQLATLIFDHDVAALKLRRDHVAASEFLRHVIQQHGFQNAVHGLAAD